MENKTKNFYQLQTHQHQNQLSVGFASLWKEQRTVPAEQLAKKSSTLKITQSRSSSDP
jgi:hypothetical protein